MFLDNENYKLLLLRRILGFLTFFCEHIEGFAEIAKPLTDLTSKKVPAKIPWEQKHQMAFDQLKRPLCKATMEPLYIVDFTKPFNLFVDARVVAFVAEPGQEVVL